MNPKIIKTIPPISPTINRYINQVVIKFLVVNMLSVLFFNPVIKYPVIVRAKNANGITHITNFTVLVYGENSKSLAITRAAKL